MDDDSVDDSLNLNAFIFVCISLCDVVVFAGMLVMCLFCWIVIPRWRKFSNYILFNTIFVFYMRLCAPIVFVLYIIISDSTNYDDDDDSKIVFYCFEYLTVLCIYSSCCWLSVMTVTVYVDIACIFNNDITKKYLKCTLFAWGVPFVFTTIQKLSIYVFKQNEISLTEHLIENALQAIILLGNIVVFSKVMWSLLRTPNLRSTNRNNLKQKIQVVTLTFVSSGSILLLSIVLGLITKKLSNGSFETLAKVFIILFEYDTTAVILTDLLYSLNLLLITVFILFSKSNREIYREYALRANGIVRNNDIEMV